MARIGRLQSGDWQQLRLRFSADSRCLLPVLVTPLKDLVRVHSMLARKTPNRSSRHKRNLHDPPLLLT